jgi:hypothetical protein
MGLLLLAYSGSGQGKTHRTPPPQGTQVSAAEHALQIAAMAVGTPHND